MVPSVQLSGDALVGVHADGESYRRAIAALPKTVKLGRKQPRADMRKMVPHLADFLTGQQVLPPSTDWRTKAALSIARMYLNDQYGDCVWASNIHLLGVTSANDKDSTGLVQATDQEVLNQYQKVCGPGDNGCVIQDTLDWGIRNGWIAGGKTYKLDGYAAVDWTNLDLMKACCNDFGGVKIGINLPSAWTSAAVWDVTNTRIVGGHDVYVIDYDADYFYLSSWGRIYKLTYAAAKSSRWLEEAWVSIVPTWYGADKTAPSGYDWPGLQAAMARLKSGTLPDEPAPVVPPAPPAPPPPPAPVVSHGTITIPPQTFHTPTFGGMVTLPAQTIPVTVSTGAANPFLEGRMDVAWLAVYRDVLKLINDYQSNAGVQQLQADLVQLAHDLGIGS